MNITFTTCEGIKKGYAFFIYPCGHRFKVRLLDGSIMIIDLAQLTGTRELRMKS